MILKCTKCQVEAPADAAEALFYRRRQHSKQIKSGWFSTCKKCNSGTISKKAKARRAQETDQERESRLLARREYYNANRDQILKSQKEYNLKTAGKRSKQSFIKKLKTYNITSREHLLRTRWYSSLPAWKKFLYKKYRHWKYNAERKDLDFKVSFNLICRMYRESSQKCFYSKRLMSLDTNNLDVISLDRINSNKGYLPDNVVLCSAIVNKMKLNLTIQEFKQIISSLHQNVR